MLIAALRHQFAAAVRASNSPARYLRLVDVLVDQAAELLDAMLLQRHPDLEGAEAARGLQAEFVQPVARGEPAGAALQIFGRRRRKSRDARARRAPGRSRPRTAHAAICAGRARRIGVLDARRRARRCRARSPAARRCSRRHGATDPLPPASIGQRFQIVDGARIHRSGIGDDARGLKPGRPVLRDRRVERRQVDAEFGIASRCAAGRGCPDPASRPPCDGRNGSGRTHRSAAAGRAPPRPLRACRCPP